MTIPIEAKSLWSARETGIVHDDIMKLKNLRKTLTHHDPIGFSTTKVLGRTPFLIWKCISGYIYCRKWPSYFDQLPPEINQNSDGKNYEQACACDETKDKGTTKKCVDGIATDWPSFEPDKYNRIKMCDRNPTKREAEVSDELTEEDYELFMKPLEAVAHNRLKRSVNAISKENATRYCSERLAETPVGKMCAKLGTNVQALVKVCSSDVEVSCILHSYLTLGEGKKRRRRVLHSL